MNYQVITTQSGLAEALAHIETMDPLAVDMEMENNFHHYGLHLALVQIAVPTSAVFIIDPLAVGDIRPLGRLLAENRHELIMHGADFDRRTCFQLFGWILGPIYDTQIAAMFCGFKQPGLAHLLSELYGLKIDKRFQKQDWMKRPITKPALEYAARDVNMLHPVREMLTARLIALGRLEWAKEEFARAGKNLVSECPEPSFCRVRNSAALSPRQLAVLKALDEYRESVARRLDKPPYYIVRDELMVALARRPPEDESKIRAIRGLHPFLYRAEGARGLCSALKAGEAAPEQFHPARRTRRNHEAPAPGWDKRLKEMRKWRLEKSLALNMEQHLVIDAAVLEWSARNPGKEFPPYVAGRIRQWQSRVILPEFLDRFAG